MTGCPCGCLTRLPYYDDPDCIRHAAPGPARDNGTDVITLGLVPHDRSNCTGCQAVGA